MTVVTLSAPYGAGGSQIGPRVAERLGVQFVDRAIPTDVAERLSVPLREAVQRDESIGGWFARALLSFGQVGPVLAGAAPPAGGVLDADVFCQATEQVLRERAAGEGAVILVLSLVGLLVSARSLQIGPVVPVIALTSTTANALTIAAGPIVFGEPLPDEPLALALRVAAFALVIGAAAMTPPPVRATAPA